MACSFFHITDQHQRGRMVPAVLTALRAAVARFSPSGPPLPAGAPVVFRSPGTTGAFDLDLFHSQENSRG